MDDEQEFRAFEREFKLISAGGAAAALRRPQGAQGDRAVPARVGAHARPHPPRGAEADHEPGLRPGADRVLRLRQARSWRWCVERRLAARDAAVSRKRGSAAAVGGDAGGGGRAERTGPPAGPGRAGGSNSSPRDATRATTGDAARHRRPVGRRHRRLQPGGLHGQRGPHRGRLEAAGAGHRARARAEGRRATPGCASPSWRSRRARSRRPTRPRAGRGSPRRRRRSSPTSSRPGTGSRCRSTRRSWACRPSESRPTSPASTRPRS